MARVHVVHTLIEAQHVRLLANGVEISTSPVTGFDFELLLNTSELPNGWTELKVVLLDNESRTLRTACVGVLIDHAVMQAAVEGVGPNGNIPIDIVLAGRSEDESYVIFAVDTLEPTLSLQYGLMLPFDLAEAVQIAAGAFPAGHDGQPIEVSANLFSTPSESMYVVVLTQSEGAWNTSNVVELQLD